MKVKIICFALFYLIVLATVASPVADFEANEVCEGNKTVFTNNSYALTGDIVLVVWDFGDGNSSNVFNPEHTYTNYGNYLVKLTVMDENGDFDYLQKTVSVFATPSVSFFASDNQPCQDEQVDFYNTTTNASTYIWKIEGQEYFTENISGSFENEGEYTVYLEAFNTNCSSKISGNINVIEKPEVDFTFENTCLGSQTEFKNETSGGTQFDWDFGDSNSSQQSNPVHVYSSQGSYIVTLQAQTTQGCTSQIQKEITIYPLPVADFSMNEVCLGDTLFISNHSSDASNFIWDFDDGTTSFQMNPKHLYKIPGIYNVNLKAESEHGCTEAIDKLVRVNTNPIALFNVTDKACVGQEVTFENLSTGGADLTNFWDFGDSFSSVVSNPTHFFSTSGDFKVQLSVENETRCRDTTKRVIHVADLPLEGHLLGDQTYCKSEHDKWISVEAYIGTIKNWEFSLNGGDYQVISSNEDTLNLNQFDVGNYTFRTRISNGICGEVLTEPYEVEIIKNSLSGRISGSSEICSGSSIQLELSDYFGEISWYKRESDNDPWNEIPEEKDNFLRLDLSEDTDFIAIVKNRTCDSDTSGIFQVRVFDAPFAGFISGNDNICVDEDAYLSISGYTGKKITWEKADDPRGPWVSLSQEGENLTLYNVTKNAFLRALVSNGFCNNDTTDVFTVTVNQKPQAGRIRGPDSSCEGMITGSFILEENSGGTISWQKSEGNNEFFTIGSGAKLLIDSVSGNARLRAIVSNEICSSDTSEIHHIKYHYVPQVSFYADTVCIGESTSLKSTSTIFNDEESNYSWLFSGIELSKVDSLIYQFPLASNPVTLTVENGACSSSVTQLVPVHRLPKGEIFTENTCYGDSARLFFSSPDSIDKLVWKYDGNVLSKEHEFFHTFTSSGSKSIELDVLNYEGCNRSFTENLTIYELPSIGLDIPSHNCKGDTAYLSLAQDKIYKNVWSIQNYGQFTGSEISLPLNNPGSFYLQVVSLSENNCVTILTDSLFVSPNPESSFSAENVCLNSLVRFTNQSSGNELEFKWNFGDGLTSEEYSPSHLYKNAGKYHVDLKVLNGSGCENNYSDEVHVFSPVTNSFTIKDICLDQKLPVEIETDTFLIKKVFWSFGDLNTSEDFEPVHYYNASGSYKITLETIDVNDCISRSEKNVNVYPVPEVGFEYQNECLGDSIEFINTSNNELNYFWDFGDGDGSILKNPAKIFWNPGFYEVQLTGVSSAGCKNQISKTIQIYEIPVADFSVDPVCHGEMSTFINQSESHVNQFYLWKIDSVKLTDENPQLNLGSGIYKVQLNVYDINGCSDSLYKYHTVYEPAKVEIEQDEINVSKGEEVVLNASGASYYSWEPIDYLSNSNIANPLTKPKDTITYYVFGVNKNGCESVDSIKVNVLEDYRILANNVFTPDGNGLNDTWIIDNLESYQPVKVEVIDRNGRVVYKSADYNNEWAGTYKGNLLPDGTYYYSIHLGNSNVKYSGAITILGDQ